MFDPWVARLEGNACTSCHHLHKRLNQADAAPFPLLAATVAAVVLAYCLDSVVIAIRKVGQ